MLLLRELGVGLPVVGQILAGERDTATPCAPSWTCCGRNRTGSAAGSRRCTPHWTSWKEVNDSWRRKSSRNSTTRSTRTRSPTVGAPRRTRTATAGGDR
ncbi:hypothetical protein [Nocardia sp. NBC_00416]|uniref:hypothetical protein n=1 Tax=Nocardia sp. NBC_00416 TaxID=2975991 RepID=UPI003FA59503